jgi:hypothetical protein
VGNAASTQLQLDIYGDLFDTVHRYVQGGHTLDVETARRLSQTADWCVRSGVSPTSACGRCAWSPGTSSTRRRCVGSRWIVRSRSLQRLTFQHTISVVGAARRQQSGSSSKTTDGSNASEAMSVSPAAARSTPAYCCSRSWATAIPEVTGASAPSMPFVERSREVRLCTAMSERTASLAAKESS